MTAATEIVNAATTGAASAVIPITTIAPAQGAAPVVAEPKAAEVNDAKNSVAIDTTSETKTNQAPTDKAQQKTEIKLELPQGTFLQAQDLERIAAESTARGLTQEQAQAELNREGAAMTRLAERHNAALEAEAKRVENESRNDPEIGGKSWNETQSFKQAVLNRFDPQKKIEAFLKETKLENDPTVLRFMREIGKAIRPDSFAGRSGSAERVEKTIGEALFANVGNSN